MEATDATTDDAQPETEVDVESLKTILGAQVDEHGRLHDAAQFDVTVAYDPKNGNSDVKVKTGTVWAFDDKAFGSVIRFSDLSGDSEDSYFIRDGLLVSVSDAGRDTDLGLVQGVSIDA